MSFRKLKLEEEYRSSEGEVYKEFYLPVLKESIIYDRAVGYFSSNVLILLAKSLVEFLEKDGKIRIIASPELSKEDIEAMEKGIKLKEEIIKEKCLKELEPTEDNIINQTRNILAWLIAEGKLEIKIAASKTKGIYHEKFGIFKDPENNVIVFSGSSNETYNGLKENFESVDVFEAENNNYSSRIKKKILNFDNMWNNNTKNLEIIDIKEVIINRILEYKTEIKPKNLFWTSDLKKELQEKDGIPMLPEWLEIREYQKEAYENWRKNKCTGILEMATGTGKTITALYIYTEICKKLRKNEIDIFTFIFVPSLVLAEQWGEECSNFNIFPLVCSSENNKWKEKLNNCVEDFNRGIKNKNVAIIVNNSVTKDNFKNIFSRISSKDKVFIIADEVHNLGTVNYLRSLPSGIKLKLGLSATPERYLDEDGNKALEKYFGEKIFSYTMKEAIKNGFLTKYYYDVVFVELTEEEYDKYIEITNQLFKMGFNGDLKDEKNKNCKMKLLERSRIIKLAENKIIELKKLLKSSKKNDRSIFYVGEGKVDKESDERLIDNISYILGKELGLKINTYTSFESPIERKKILNDFKNGYLDGLVAMKCLDEGVNIPSVERAYILASTTNPKEYIQRRGRVLRLSKETNKEFAYIYDFIVVPNLEKLRLLNKKYFNIERGILRKEFLRVKEFSKLSENEIEIEKKYLCIKRNLTY